MNANLIQIKVKHDKTLNYNCLDKKKKCLSTGWLTLKKKIHSLFFLRLALTEEL